MDIREWMGRVYEKQKYSSFPLTTFNLCLNKCTLTNMQAKATLEILNWIDELILS